MQPNEYAGFVSNQEYKNLNINPRHDLSDLEKLIVSFIFHEPEKPLAFLQERRAIHTSSRKNAPIPKNGHSAYFGDLQRLVFEYWKANEPLNIGYWTGLNIRALNNNIKFYERAINDHVLQEERKTIQKESTATLDKLKSIEGTEPQKISYGDFNPPNRGFRYETNTVEGTPFIRCVRKKLRNLENEGVLVHYMKGKLTYFTLHPSIKANFG